MADALSAYLEAAIYNMILKNTAYTPPTDLYVALYTTDPTDADTGSEVTGGNYARIAVTFGSPSGGSGTNSGAVTWAAATWTGTVTHVGIRDALTSGHLLLHAQLDAPKTIGVGDVFSFANSSLSVVVG